MHGTRCSVNSPWQWTGERCQACLEILVDLPMTIEIEQMGQILMPTHKILTFFSQIHDQQFNMIFQFKNVSSQTHAKTNFMCRVHLMKVLLRAGTS